MKNLIVISLSILYSHFLFSQQNNQKVTNELIIKFKANKKPNSKDVLIHQKFDNSVINMLNTNNTIQSIKLTGHKKQKDTYVLNFNADQPIEKLVELYQ